MLEFFVLFFAVCTTKLLQDVEETQKISPTCHGYIPFGIFCVSYKFFTAPPLKDAD